MAATTNLDRWIVNVDSALKAATERGDHAHAGIFVGCGEVQCGPVVGWEYDPTADGHGWIEIRNYRGQIVRTGLNLVSRFDIRACWDRC